MFSQRQAVFEVLVGRHGMHKRDGVYGKDTSDARSMEGGKEINEMNGWGAARDRDGLEMARRLRSQGKKELQEGSSIKCPVQLGRHGGSGWGL